MIRLAKILNRLGELPSSILPFSGRFPRQEIGLFIFDITKSCQLLFLMRLLFSISNTILERSFKQDKMRYRIGYGGPEGFQHGYRRPTGNLNEFERLLHLIVSLQILFGSRRGGILIPLLLVGLAFGGWWVYMQYNGPDRQLARADQKWDSGDTTQQIQAIREYKVLLRKKDPLDNGLNLLRDGRERLYRRIITFHVLFNISDADANDWIREAWDEGFRDLGFEEEKVETKWKEATEGMKRHMPDDNLDKDVHPSSGDPDSIPGSAVHNRLPSNAISARLSIRQRKLAA